MRKALSIVVLCAMMIAGLFQNQVQAASNIVILIDGKPLYTDQGAVMQNGRTLVPMRAIFEALSAEVWWDDRTKTVTAVKKNTTIRLTIGSRTAYINNAPNALDVPASVINGRTLVPVRFVSESLGEDVVWDPGTKRVIITTSVEVQPAYSVSLNVVGQNGDGRDLQVNFSKSPDESLVGQYRVMIVKSRNAGSFNLQKAEAVPSGNYTPVYPTGNNPRLTLNAQTRDVDGDLIQPNETYCAFVLTVGNAASRYESALSAASPSVSLLSSLAASNVKATDTNDYGDGRDLTVSFIKAKDDAQIAYYRVLVVKTKDAGNFDVAAANRVSASYSTNVYKTSGTTLTATLSASSRDTSGDLIKNGVAYTVFVLSVHSQSSGLNKLSAGSPPVTLSNNLPITAPANVKADDVSDYGDGRDLQVSFTKSGDESKVSYYRIFAVKNASAGSFTLSDAVRVSAGNYYDVYKTGYDITLTLPATMKDTQGDYIRNGQSYRLFVMAAGNGNAGYQNALSAASPVVTLSYNAVNTVSNLRVSDVDNYGDGRDLLVEFDRARDESLISHYRVLVVKSASASSFNLAAANAVPSANYTLVAKTGGNLSLTLPSTARDVDGALIRNGVGYKVFVLSVGYSGVSGNALSSASSAITLADSGVGAATNVQAGDISDYGDGRDLQVTFNRAGSESGIAHYRVLVVKSANASSFNLAAANAVPSANYTLVAKTGGNLSLTLPSTARDVDGALIRNGVSYRVFVLSVSSAGASRNALSAASPVVVLSSNAVAPATNVSAAVVGSNGNGSDLSVTFTKSADDAYVAQYRVMVVRSDLAGSFDLKEANATPYYTVASSSSSYVALTLPAAAKDVKGNDLARGVAYKVFVLAVADTRYRSINALSAPSGEVSLTAAVQAATGVTAMMDTTDPTGSPALKVTFHRPDYDNNISGYAVFAVPDSEAGSFDLATANATRSYVSVPKGGDTLSATVSQDTKGNALDAHAAYYVFVLSIADGNSATVNALSTPVRVTLSNPAP